MRLARHGKGRQALQGVGAHQGDSKAKGTRCVPLRTSKNSRRGRTSACSTCLPPRDRLGGEDARRQTKRSFRAMTFWAWLRPYQSRLTGDRVGRCPLRCWKGCIPLHPRARLPLPARCSYAFRASASGAPLPSAQRCVTSPGSVRGGRSHPGWGSSPSQSSSADSHKLTGISKCGPRLLRMLLMECAWTCARARPTLSKSCPASVDLHIREHARLLLEEAAAREGRLTLQRQCHHSSRAGKVHALP